MLIYTNMNPRSTLAQVKGFVAKNSTTCRLQDAKDIAYGAFGKITKMYEQKQKNMWSKLKKNTAKKIV